MVLLEGPRSCLFTSIMITRRCRYILMSADHGYHLGQYRLPMEKMWPFETDTRIPFWMRGPGIAAGISRAEMGLNSDIAATLLDLAGIPIPNIMDGKSLAPLVLGTQAQQQAASAAWRTHIPHLSASC